MLTVGLTGGIACGKSHVLREFHRHGAVTIDADQIGHRLIEPGTPAHAEILSIFGAGIADSQGRIDRRKLGGLVFSDSSARQKLTEILHPLILAEEMRFLRDAASWQPPPPMAMVDAALMVETGFYRNYDVLVVVYCRPDIQLRRLILRDRLSEDEAALRIMSQMPLLEKAKYGDYVIENSGRLADTSQQVRYVFMDLIQRFENGN